MAPATQESVMTSAETEPDTAANCQPLYLFILHMISLYIYGGETGGGRVGVCRYWNTRACQIRDVGRSNRKGNSWVMVGGSLPC